MSRATVPKLILAGAAGGIVLLLLYVLFAGGATYTVTAHFTNAGQLVPGNQVQIGGLRVGSVKSIDLSDDGIAEVELEIKDEYAPLHQNTAAVIRVPGLAGIAARYVALTPGPDDGPEIPDGGILPQEDTQGPVEVDAFFSALDPRTLQSLQNVIQGSSEAFTGRGKAAMRAINELNPALGESAATLREVMRDEAAIDRVLDETAGIVKTLAARGTEIEQGTTAAATATGALARQRAALTDVLTETPGALRQANTTLHDVRGLLNTVRPAIPEGRPAARDLSRLLPRLRPLVRRVRREGPAVRRLAARDLPGLLDQLPGLADAGVPPLEGLAKALDDLSPVLATVRAYTPEIIHGLGGVGGISSGYYDASGEYSRVMFVGGERQLTGPLGGLADVFSQSAVRRCPGAAETYPPADGSAPFRDGGRVSCDPDLGIERP